MKNTLYLLAACLVLCFACEQKPDENADAVEDSQTDSLRQIELADPTIFESGGKYYLYGTGDPNGFKVYQSEDLKHWSGPAGKSDGLALKKGDAFGDKGFWAPQVIRYRDTLFMAYTANEHIAIARGSDPLGPFSQTNKVSLEAPVKQIDPFLFVDDDGKVYLYHVRLQDGNRIFVVEMEPDLSAMKEETLRECIAAEEPWENTAGASWPVAEGPSVFKYNDLYYLIYSANDFRNPDYAVGYATSDSPLGPWHKSPLNPIISRHFLGYNGTGHGDFFYDHDGVMHYVFHIHQSNSRVSPRRTALVPVTFDTDSSGMASMVIHTNEVSLLKAGEN